MLPTLWGLTSRPAEEIKMRRHVRSTWQEICVHILHGCLGLFFHSNKDIIDIIKELKGQVKKLIFSRFSSQSGAETRSTEAGRGKEADALHCRKRFLDNPDKPSKSAICITSSVELQGCTLGGIPVTNEARPLSLVTYSAGISLFLSSIYKETTILPVSTHCHDSCSHTITQTYSGLSIT